jgi:hypothetical protein
MAATMMKTNCAVCSDRLRGRTVECCGRCQQLVCRACSKQRGRTHESVLCSHCLGLPRPAGLRATSPYRAWKRLRLAA